MGSVSSVSDNTLYYSHLGATVLHGVEAIAGYSLTNTVAANKGDFALTNNVSFGVPKKTPSQTILPGTYKLGNLISTFPALSMVNHLWAVCFFDSYKKQIDEKKTNPVRWVEYSASAGLMTWAIAQLSGEADIKSLIQLLLSNAVMQYCGLLVEQDVAMSKSPNTLKVREFAKRRALVHEALGFVLFFSIWAALFTSFFTSIKKANDENAVSGKAQVPDIVWAIIFVLFGFFLAFGCVSASQVYGAYHPESRLALVDFRKVELLYLMLSLSAKSALFGMVFGGVIFQNNENQT